MKPADSRSEGSAREGNNNNPRIADFIGVTGTGARHSGNHRQPKVPKNGVPQSSARARVAGSDLRERDFTTAVLTCGDLT
jgi:hypothetical protein